MAKKFILKLFYFITTFLLICLAKIALYLNAFGVRKDYIDCRNYINTAQCSGVSDLMVKCLVLAEDHRNHMHYGIDILSIARASIQCCKGNVQGGSTIEQQFVRVVTGNYERTISRKLREQILAVLVSNYHSKKNVSKAYLCFAYYGSGLYGIAGIKDVLSKGNYISTDEGVISVISRLKYPESIKNKKLWLVKHERRNAHIRKLLKSANKSSQKDTLREGDLSGLSN